MVIDRWSPQFRALYGGEFPVDYCCIDTETTGSNPDHDLILEFGWCLVHDREVASQGNLVLNWTGHAVVPEAWLRGQLERIANVMTEQGKPWRLTPSVLKREGVEPTEGLELILSFLDGVREAGTLLVAHNGYAFDQKMLAANFAAFLGVEGYRFGENGCIDTGAIEKAGQSERADLLPTDEDTLESYFRRVTSARLKGVRWALDAHCVPKYGLDRHYGIDTSLCHTAGYDAYVCHLLMETFRAQLGRTPAPAPSAVTPPWQEEATVPRMRRQRVR